LMISISPSYKIGTARSEADTRLPPRADAGRGRSYAESVEMPAADDISNKQKKEEEKAPTNGRKSVEKGTRFRREEHGE